MSVETAKETLGFQAEVKQLLHLMVHSLYSNKEIFLRELISNASDAADRLKFEALANSSLYEDDSELKVWVYFDKAARTITIKDNGIGMNRQEVIKNLGTIAKSGTKEFLKTLTGDKAKDSKLIGQFGVGFYSSFIVADKVTVTTRKAGEPKEQGVKWVSKAEGDYEIENVYKADRGTEIVLHLKPEEEEFLNGWHLRHVITKYSDHITLPIVMEKEKEEKNEQEQGQEKPEGNIIDVPEEEVINRATALWTLPRQEITDEQYTELYKHVAHDFEEPLAWAHNKVEGKLEYTSLLYIPKRAPFDLWNAAKPRGLKLYVSRVFIMDDAEVFLPTYLRFVKGIIDSNDLPLNVSREILQSNKTVDSVRNALVKRILGMLDKLAANAPEKYKIFWKEFGQILKEGPAEDFANKEAIAKLLRFASTCNDKEEPEVSLVDYCSRMSDKQDKIYYMSADSFAAAKNSSHLEIFRKKGIEVLLLSDKVDEWLMAHLTEFQGKKFQSVARGNLDLGELDDDKEEIKKSEEEASKKHKDIIDKIKDLLKDKVKDVKITRRLTTSPACIIADEHDMTPQMQRIMQAAGQNVPVAKPILEINPEHMLVQRLKQEQGQRFSDLANLLFEQAVLAAGGQLDDASGFVTRLNALLLDISK